MTRCGAAQRGKPSGEPSKRARSLSDEGRDKASPFRWPQKTAHRIYERLTDDPMPAFSDAWHCALEVAIGLYRRPRGDDPLHVLVVTDRPGDVRAFARCLFGAIGGIRKDDPGWDNGDIKPSYSTSCSRRFTVSMDIRSPTTDAITDGGGPLPQPKVVFRPVHVWGFVDGSVQIMERVLSHERQHGFGWTRSQDIVLKQVLLACEGDRVVVRRAREIEAVYLKRNTTHRALMDAGDDFQREARALIRNALNDHLLRCSQPSREEVEALFGGQTDEWIFWLSLQLTSGDMIPPHVAAEWLASCT